ncbi:pre-rRNA-processing protein TSR2 homolog isoform X1 [Branchiostoma lanceolatum]|uniref:pre-rRNA-processing protein TSR2 homolog isoform X1 n=1 Tax=Branchiostoma lanceolatum TaxID=7740 RepID=UPI0034545F86
MAAPMDIFRDSVKSVLDGWTVLQLAVQHGFGGVHSTAKAAWMGEAVSQWFQENADIDPSELEDFLAEILNNEFDTVADDGSLSQVAQQICGSYRLCLQGRQQEVLSRIQQLPKAQLSGCVAATGPEQEEEDDEDDEKEEEMDEQDMEVTPSSSIENGPQHQKAQNQQEDTTPNTSVQDMESQSQENVDDGWTVVTKKKKR